MAGGPLFKEEPTELCARANVLVARPPGGIALVSQVDTERDVWRVVEPCLHALALVLLVRDDQLRARLTFFTSTFPLVLLAEIDGACYREMSTAHVDRLVLQTWAERYRLTHALLHADGPIAVPPTVALPHSVHRIVTQYMETYFSKE
ncbi:hypothetical protein FGB62_58g021 [Gracilaria domingensis]|nr:hypothetical protein FGB62_58g021 [Gracilaria domingensis]